MYILYIYIYIYQYYIVLHDLPQAAQDGVLEVHLALLGWH